MSFTTFNNNHPPSCACVLCVCVCVCVRVRVCVCLSNCCWKDKRFSAPEYFWTMRSCSCSPENSYRILNWKSVVSVLHIFSRADIFVLGHRLVSYPLILPAKLFSFRPADPSCPGQRQQQIKTCAHVTSCLCPWQHTAHAPAPCQGLDMRGMSAENFVNKWIQCNEGDTNTILYYYAILIHLYGIRWTEKTSLSTFSTATCKSQVYIPRIYDWFKK